MSPRIFWLVQPPRVERARAPRAGLVQRVVTAALLVLLLGPNPAPAGSLASSAAGAAVSVSTIAPVPRFPVQTTGLVYQRTMTELDSFTGWLHQNCAQGFVGEIGWPDRPADAAQWNGLANAWLDRAQSAGLWVAVWVTRESTGPTHQLAPYESVAPFQPLSVADPQAAVLEAHPSLGTFENGVNSGNGEGGFPELAHQSVFSNANPGNFGNDYSYDTRATYRYLASRGVSMIRIPFRWERLQPHLYGPLEPTELARLQTTVSEAESEGLRVILDLHNFGGYFINDPVQQVGVRIDLGSPELPASALIDFWSRMGASFRADPGVAAYDLMNEPIGLQYTDTMTPAQVWETASQQVVNAIRASGDNKLLMVDGYQWSGMEHWTTAHPTAWINDPGHNFRYEAHQYWDYDHTSRYLMSYGDEETALTSQGLSLPPVPAATRNCSAP